MTEPTIVPGHARRVHVLHYGMALCFLPGWPANWPAGDTWVPVSEWRKSTCERCRFEAEVLEGELGTRNRHLGGAR